MLKVFIVCAVAGFCYAVTPAYETGVSFMDVTGDTLDVGSFSAPYVVDWNGDGQKDLLLGSNFGNIYCYSNVGSSPNPVLPYPAKLRADGSPIALSSG